jgi:hypothetical protein
MMNLRLTICREYADNGQPIVVIGVLVPPFVSPTIFQTKVVAAMLTAMTDRRLVFLVFTRPEMLLQVTI